MFTTRRETPVALPAPPAPGADDAWALFLDVDGTLLDLAHHPDAVRVDAQLHDDLAGVRQRLSGALALLSGRRLAELDALFAWHRRAAAGLHGAELRTPDQRHHFSGDAESFNQMRQLANRLVTEAPGVLLEDKQRALGLHYRNAPTMRDQAERIAAALLQHAGSGWALQRGNHVIELRPAGVDKGRALDALMAEAPFRSRRPWVLGDDLTDEDAFEHVNARDGISVVVGPRRPTAARFAMAGPALVRAWLHRIALAAPQAPSADRSGSAADGPQTGDTQ